MKKMNIVVVISFLLLILSGCSNIEKESLTYLNGYKDEEIKYFDEYSEVYKNNEFGIKMYAVRSENIADDDNNEFVNYILKWDNEKVLDILLTCGNHTLYHDGSTMSAPGYIYYLISGQEISDYCQDISYFEMSVNNNESKINLRNYLNTAIDEINWENVDEINDNIILSTINKNIEVVFYVILIIIVALVLIFGYKVIHKKNINNFLKGEKVKKLPDLLLVIILITVIAFIGTLLIIERNLRVNVYHNNLFDYELREHSVLYLPKFINNNYELMSSNGTQEVYLEKRSNDAITFHFVLLDGEERYDLGANGFSFPSVADFDGCNIEFKEENIESNGLLLGHVVDCYKIIDGKEESNFAITYGQTTRINGNGKTVLVDVYRDTVYYKNAKGYYSVHTPKEGSN